MENSIPTPTIKDKIKHLAEIANTYEPSNEVIDKIRGKKLICLIGAFAIDESDVIRKLVDVSFFEALNKNILDPISNFIGGESSIEKEPAKDKFSQVISFTTQESLRKYPNYRFYKKTPKNLQMLTEKANASGMVSLSVDQVTGDISGTWPEDYKEGYNVLGTTLDDARKIKQIKELDTTAIALVMDRKEYLEKINNKLLRMYGKTVNGEKKLSVSPISFAREAEKDLDSYLNENGILFVKHSSSPAKTAESIRQIAAGSPSDQEGCRLLAEEMLKLTKNIQKNALKEESTHTSDMGNLLVDIGLIAHKGRFIMQRKISDRAYAGIWQKKDSIF